jgi:hypothetical protein
MCVERSRTALNDSERSRVDLCPESVTDTDRGRRQAEHVDVTVSTNGALLMLITAPPPCSF